MATRKDMGMSTVGVRELKNQLRKTRLARLAAQGLVALPTHKPLRRVRPVKVSGAPLSKTILQDRR